MKKDSKVANSNTDRKDSLVKLLILTLFSKGLSTQMLIVSSYSIFVNKDSNIPFTNESLFTNIPLEETINMCIDKLFENNTKVNNLTKESFRSLLELATLESLFIFNGKYYKQKDGVAMGSPFGPTLANVFLCHFEEQWMSDCPIDYKPISYRRYVDDTFLLFSSELHVTKFLNYMNSKHRNIKFTVEREENNSLSFLDIKIFRDGGKFQTSVYRKSTFSGVLTNFESILPISPKYNLVSTLLHRCL